MHERAQAVLCRQLHCHAAGQEYLAQKGPEPIAFQAVLDLTPWMHPSLPDLADDMSLEYDLTSIIQHLGRQAGKGHNTVYCRLAPKEGTALFPPFLVNIAVTEQILLDLANKTLHLLQNGLTPCVLGRDTLDVSKHV